MTLNRRKFLAALLAAPVAAKAAPVVGETFFNLPANFDGTFIAREIEYVSDGSLITLIEARMREALEHMQAHLMYESCMYGTGVPVAVTFPPKIQTKFNPARLPL